MTEGGDPRVAGIKNTPRCVYGCGNIATHAVSIGRSRVLLCGTHADVARRNLGAVVTPLPTVGR